MLEYNKKIIKYVIITLTILICLISIVLVIVWKVWGNYFKVNEWLTFCSTIVTTLLGVYATMIVVVISIEFTKKDKDEIKKENIRKSHKKLYTEMTKAISSIKIIFYDYIVESFRDYGEVNENFKKKIYKIDSGVMDIVYELLIEDEDNIELERVKNFFSNYNSIYNSIECEEKIENIIMRIVFDILDTQYYELLDIIFLKSRSSETEYSMYEKYDYYDEKFKRLREFNNKYKFSLQNIKIRYGIDESLEYLRGKSKN
ncbi:hypothetical protein ACSXCI_07280 [Clostridium perfringens]